MLGTNDACRRDQRLPDVLALPSVGMLGDVAPPPSQVDPTRGRGQTRDRSPALVPRILEGAADRLHPPVQGSLLSRFQLLDIPKVEMVGTVVMVERGKFLRTCAGDPHLHEEAHLAGMFQ